MGSNSIKQLPRPAKKAEFEDKFGLLGDSQGILQVIEIIEQVAPTNIAVLLIGESGTGKEVVARAIQGKSQRKDRAFIVVNCAAIPEGILESELFGHEKGAFTGAIGIRKGYFELADGGTIFLDEIGEMPLNTQSKLLRILEGGQFMRVGGSETRTVDVRVIAATNRNLEEAVRKEEFRHDLFFRLNAVKIVLPPLRERKSDIRKLISKFAQDFCRENKIEFQGFTERAYEILENHHWPGNIRELKNQIESMIVLERGQRIDEHNIRKYIPIDYYTERNMPIPLKKSPEQAERELIYSALLDLKHEIVELRQIILERAFPSRQLPSWSPHFPATYMEEEIIPKENGEASQTMDDMEKNLILEALRRNGGSKRKAAKQLNISERTLYRKIKEYDLPY
ncbi:sigma 54-interacting transcriptional regulator [candidate division KSB1 bacterium]|nr:sigma 54-interacting transcriptional regulator [candidate division KSB1 bacterium]